MLFLINCVIAVATSVNGESVLRFDLAFNGYLVEDLWEEGSISEADLNKIGFSLMFWDSSFPKTTEIVAGEIATVLNFQTKKYFEVVPRTNDLPELK